MSNRNVDWKGHTKALRAGFALMVCLATQGCTFVGAGLGAAIGNAHPRFDPVPFHQLLAIRPGSEVRIIDSSGQAGRAEYGGAYNAANEAYSAAYARWATGRIGDSTQPLQLQERVSIRRQDRDLDGRFVGLMRDTAHFLLDDGTLASIAMDQVDHIVRRESGTAWGTGGFQAVHAAAPQVEGIMLVDPGTGARNALAWDQIRRVEERKAPYREARIGMVVGILVDVGTFTWFLLHGAIY